MSKNQGVDFLSRVRSRFINAQSREKRKDLEQFIRECCIITCEPDADAYVADRLTACADNLDAALACFRDVLDKLRLDKEWHEYRKTITSNGV